MENMTSNSDVTVHQGSKNNYVTPQLKPSIRTSDTCNLESLLPPTTCLPTAATSGTASATRHHTRLRRKSEGDAAVGKRSGCPLGPASCLFGASVACRGQEAAAEVPATGGHLLRPLRDLSTHLVSCHRPGVVLFVSMWVREPLRYPRYTHGIYLDTLCIVAVTIPALSARPLAQKRCCVRATHLTFSLKRAA